MKEFESVILRRLLKKINVSHLSELDRNLWFYKTVLELERIKEPDILDLYSYLLHFKSNDRDVMLLDLPCNLTFTKAFLDNRNLTFPKDLYISLSIINRDRTNQMILLSQTIDYAALNGYDPYDNLLPIRISDFSLDMRNIDALELTEDKLETIEGELNHIKDFRALEALIKKHLGENVELKKELQVGLSTKNISLSQISSELNKLSSVIINDNDLLKSFLTHSQFDNLIEKISVDELITVSSLDESQAKVVAHALGNKFTVVTGAPGTGKTQVILNIIANALISDKSVLMASKNNKAVDNVKERFDKIDKSQYLLRFGKKEYLRSQTLLSLAQHLNRIESLKDQPDTFTACLSQYKKLIKIIRDARKKLSKIEELKVSIPKLLSEKSKIESQIKTERIKFESTVELLHDNYSDFSHINDLDYNTVSNATSQLVRYRNYLQYKYSGFTKIWHNTFSKKKHAKKYLDYIESLPSIIRAQLRDRKLTCSLEDFRTGQDIIQHADEVIRILERIGDWINAINIEKTRYSDKNNSLRKRLEKANRNYNVAAVEFEELSKIKNTLNYNISLSKEKIKNLGPQLLTAKIDQIEKAIGSSHKISSYKSFLPDKIPWKKEDVPNFILRCKDFLSVCRLISTTSLSIKSNFPLTNNLFDILIIDEASQCDVASALPLILRAKQVVIIGDPMQLRHITSVKSEEEDIIREHLGLSNNSYLKYVEQSLWDYSTDFLAHANQNNGPVTLENHYRCHRDIIGYSNHQFYTRFLNKPLNVLTDESKISLPQTGIIMINLRGKQESDNLNINKAEAARAVSLAKELGSLNSISIGIVTPFRDQADYINSLLDDSLRLRVEVNTAYGFQGNEKDVMIYSLVITDNSPKRKINWIDYRVPNLVNVAVTRARQTLYIIGNADYIKSMSPENNALGFLIRYAQSKNN